jgi:hypothetical protein
MEFPWPKWMELVMAGGLTVICVFALAILSRIQKPEEETG